MNDMCRFILQLYFWISIDLITSFCATLPLFIQLYVVPFPSLIGNDGDGSLLHPHSSVQQALNHIQSEYRRNIKSTGRTPISLYPTHHFVDTLHFTQGHSRIRLATMTAKDIIFFQYQPGLFDYKSLADAMVTVYHSWTTFHHYIGQLITANNTVLFTNPSNRPIGI